VEEALLIMSTKPKMAEGTTYAESKKIKDIFERFNYLYPDRPISFADIDVFIQGRADVATSLEKQGIDRTDLFENTVAIADSVKDYEFYEDLKLLPQPKVDASERLRKECVSAMKSKGLSDNDTYTQRLERELGVISSKGFDSYLLVVAVAIRWARRKNILVGPGRGSAAGSLVCYLMGITQVDPIKYGLLFERFINEERNDFPDIDTDFQDTRRGEVKDYLARKFKNVASIATYSYFKDKGVVRDAARIFGVPLGDVNKALKTVDKFEDFETSPNTADFRKQYPEVLEYARKLRGRIRGTGMHAAGVVVAKEPISHFAPLETRADDKNLITGRTIVTAYDKDQVADIGLIKLDFLGLKTLSVVSDTIALIKDRHGVDIDPVSQIDLDDPEVHAMLSAGFTLGVFQVEATPYTNLIVNMGTSKFDHLAASNALVRPGAMNTVGESFVARKHGREQVSYAHPILEDITKETYGVIIYQEQVMRAMVELAGMSGSEADNVRKLIGHKEDVSRFEKYRDQFVQGASKHISVADAERLWHDFEAHAGYSFNKSHAVAYSTLSMWTAWLKYYYPTEFMTALLRNEGQSDSITDYLIEAKRLGIRILLPHVNKSAEDFTIDDSDINSIRFGLGNIKSISPDKGAPRILAGAPYSSYEQLREYAAVKGSGINTRMIDSLNAVGAASFSDNPLTGKESDNYYEYLNIPKFRTGNLPKHVMSQVSKLSEFDEYGCFVVLAMVKSIKRGKGWSRIELVDDSGSIGIFHKEQTTIETGQMYLMLVAENRVSRFIPIDEVEDRAEDALVRYLYAEEIKVPDDKRVVIAFNSLKTKAGKAYAHVVVSNNKKEMERVIAFNKVYPKALGKCQNGAVVKLSLGALDDGGHYIKDIIND